MAGMQPQHEKEHDSTCINAEGDAPEQGNPIQSRFHYHYAGSHGEHGQNPADYTDPEIPFGEISTGLPFTRKENRRYDENYSQQLD